MKKNLLLMMLYCPIVLAAQNGVTVSNLTVSAGSPTTVTFNVNWKNTGMPALWSDTVWVFVDYNDAGVMKRLPLSPGATLTATSAPDVGKVIEETGNNQGVWVTGNARANSSFSATVQLFTAVSNVGGACVYGSNYPPVGEYNDDATKITFTGTPKYDLVLEKIADGSTYTISTTGLYPRHAGEVIQSFTDRTGAPGIMKCTAPGSTVNFTAFNPCSDAATGATWTLQDTREPTNHQNYKVKKMPDGHIWMVQDLKFGDKCDKTDFTRSTSDRTGNVTSLTDKLYYGDCKNVTDASTPPNKGYYYDWAAAINLPKAYYGSGIDVGCSGTGASANACQGICPNGWHVPSGSADGEPNILRTFNVGCDYNTPACWMSADGLETVLGGWVDDNGSVMWPEHWNYWTSTKIENSIYIYTGDIDFLRLDDDNPVPGGGFRLRCVLNY
jgi:uncharacterized protein (TIGR02145 family)